MLFHSESVIYNTVILYSHGVKSFSNIIFNFVLSFLFNFISLISVAISSSLVILNSLIAHVSKSNSLLNVNSISLKFSVSTLSRLNFGSIVALSVVNIHSGDAQLSLLLSSTYVTMV